MILLRAKRETKLTRDSIITKTSCTIPSTDVWLGQQSYYWGKSKFTHLPVSKFRLNLISIFNKWNHYKYILAIFSDRGSLDQDTLERETTTEEAILKKDRSWGKIWLKSIHLTFYTASTYSYRQTSVTTWSSTKAEGHLSRWFNGSVLYRLVARVHSESLFATSRAATGKISWNTYNASSQRWTNRDGWYGVEGWIVSIRQGWMPASISDFYGTPGFMDPTKMPEEVQTPVDEYGKHLGDLVWPRSFKTPRLVSC